MCSCFLCNKIAAQCITPISVFPFSEGFETSDGNWTIGGSASSWAWGSPAKPVINTAGGGSKCWTTGSLNNGFYNSGESSWLQSPCFDFTNLAFPYISVKIWWETERGFDGSNLQFSTDNGTTWTNIGTAAGIGTCLDLNWYNSQSVRFLGPFGSFPEGWSGSSQATSGSCIGGGGSGGWVTAKHILNGLGGKPAVILRFTFGAGTQCNNYDGFAIDDVLITNAPPNNGTIEQSCVENNTVDFQFNANLCPATYNWDFADVASGPNNISTSPNPRHVFSAPGTYRVSLTVGGSGNGNFTTTSDVTILGATVQIVTPIYCGGAVMGSISVKAIGSSGPFSYFWNTSPSQTNDTAINLAPGTYIVDVSSPGACPINKSIELKTPLFSITDTVQQPGCLYSKGKIILQVQEGLPPYSYTWSPTISTDSFALTLDPGNYTVTVIDSRNCIETRNYTIITFPKPVVRFSNIVQANCNGLLFGSAIAIVQNGTPPFLYQWNTTPPQTNDTVFNLNPGNYSVIIKDANGCEAKDSITIGLGGVCNDVYFPNAFSPDGNASNETFGPQGNVIEISNYLMTIYNRYGQPVFSSSNPLLKWDGNLKGTKQATGTYVWLANYLYKKTIRRSQKGTIILLR